ncbi:PLP-dependent aminotransferase family protein [Micromonospora sp. NBC_01699]|uniref:aminotransferase-like domain-containing protein n=1 Tax=Micromonospora sp. NBC_01699 TaxID=2975984 RepID=UPI002E323F15|nr:PLP-dependent aminotransferase family protein [Micromonospora sp. NBC_01699]
MSATASNALPIVQFRSRPGTVDLAWGHPDPATLPIREWAQACVGALRRYGGSALAYGHPNGPGPLVEWLVDRLGRTDGRAPDPPRIFVTAGASHALDLVAGLLCRSGDTVLVDAPTYHLAFRVLADHGVTLAPTPADRDGIDPAATRDLVARLRREGRRVPLLYLVPTFGNPTGRSLAEPRRAELVAVAEQTGLVLVEDDTYRELAYDGPAPPSLYSAAEDGAVIRLGSFAKTVAPGLRLGWLTAAPALVAALAGRGYIDSGGGVNHTNALSMAEFATAGAYDRHLDRVRARYRGQRDALVSAVHRHLPEVTFTTPAGGWFLWLRLPAPIGATALLPYADTNGVSYLPGTHFFVTDTGDTHLRLSFSLFAPDQLEEGTRRLARAMTQLGSAPEPGRPQ